MKNVDFLRNANITKMGDSGLFTRGELIKLISMIQDDTNDMKIFYIIFESKKEIAEKDCYLHITMKISIEDVIQLIKMAQL